MKGSRRAFAVGIAAMLVLAACSSSPSASGGGGGGGALTKVRFQLQWVAQAQFAGYFAALDQGYYKDAGLDVSLLLGGPNVNNVQVVATGGADIGTAWLPNMLQSREGGTDLVSIAQIFQRSGTRMASFKAANITDPKSMDGKKIGSWLGGNEPELFAALTKAGLDPTKENIIKQDFDMSGLLKGDLDVAQAMIYNEYAQVLEAPDPNTGELYKPDQLNIINWNDYRVSMLQDAIFVRKSWLDQGTNRDVAVRFVRASLRGWIYCRDHPADCVQYTIAAGSQLGVGHQTWMMNEINALVWPSPVGVGVIDPIFWGQTVKIAKNAGIIKKDPTIDAYTTDIVAEASKGLTDDLKGTSFTKGTVEVTPGGN